MTGKGGFKAYIFIPLWETVDELLFLELRFSNKALQSKYYVQESKYMEMSDNAFSVCVRLRVHASLPV